MNTPMSCGVKLGKITRLFSNNMRQNPHISIAIPTSDFPNGDFLLRRCLDSLWSQIYMDFEVIITDNSTDTVIEAVCDDYRGLNIAYYRNPVKGMAQNTNEAIRRSKGKLIKILYMDDFMAHRRSLKYIADNFTEAWSWLVTGCTHKGEEDYFNPRYPYYSQDIHTGNNTIGSPSVLTIRNEEPLMFDEKMTWLLDADYYRRMYDLHGEPLILKDINVVMGIHNSQATQTLSDERKLKELEYMKKKHA